MTNLPKVESETQGHAASNAEMCFKVLVNDNFHYMDKDERWKLGAFATVEEAVVACESMVEACLADYYQPGMDAE